MAEEEPLTEERVGNIVKLFLTTTPNMFKKPWLATPEEDLQPFVHELTIYCRNHDLDPSEYFGDWFPVAMTAIPIGAGIVEKYRDHKKEVKATKDAEEKTTEECVTPHDHTDVVRKDPIMNATSSGGDNLPEEEEEVPVINDPVDPAGHPDDIGDIHP